MFVKNFMLQRNKYFLALIAKQFIKENGAFLGGLSCCFCAARSGAADVCRMPAIIDA
jgi:hypothetical protein